MRQLNINKTNISRSRIQSKSFQQEDVHTYPQIEHFNILCSSDIVKCVNANEHRYMVNTYIIDLSPLCIC